MRSVVRPSRMIMSRDDDDDDGLLFSPDDDYDDACVRRRDGNFDGYLWTGNYRDRLKNGP